MADRIAVMMDGDIVQVGSPRELHDQPADTRVARFLGTPAINMLPGSLEGDGTVRVKGLEEPVARAADRARQGDVDVGVRAEHLHLAASQSARTLPATVRTVEYLGSDALVHIVTHLGDEERVLVARVSSDDLSIHPGTEVGLIAPSRVHVFGADGRRIAVEPPVVAQPQVSAA